MRDIILFMLIFLAGTFVGIFFYAMVIAKSRDYAGTIVIHKIEGKTLYSLELEDYPEKIEFKKKVVFKIESPGESLGRE